MLGFLIGLFSGALALKIYNHLAANRTQALDDATSNQNDSTTLQKSRSLAFNASAAADANDRSGSFLTDVIASLWSHMNTAISAEVKATVEPMFKEMLPGPLKSMHFTKCSLGDVPLRLDNCIVHECKTNLVGKEYVQIEIDVVWDGQCDIELKADYIGRLGVKHLKLSGRMSFLLQPVMDTIPVVGAVQYGFVNPPQLELDFTGLANVADISSIKTTINKTIADILAGMMVLPNRMMTKLNDSTSFFEAYQPPLGVARFSILRGRGFTEEKRKLRKADIPDVYCIVSMAGREIWTTEVVQDSTEPVWSNQETADILLDDHNQTVTIRVLDRDEGTLDADDDLGMATLTVGEILLAGKVKEVELQDEGGRGTGAFISIGCELLKLEPKLESIEQDMNQLNDKMYNGLLTILLSQASGIAAPPAAPEGEDPVAPDLYFIKATYGDESFYTSALDGQAAIYNSSFRIPLIESDKPAVKLALYKGSDTTEEGKDNELVGEFEVLNETILNSPSYTISTSRQVCDGSPSLEYSISICGLVGGSGVPLDTTALASTTAKSGSGDDDTPVAVTILKGWGFKAQPRRLKKADVPDVYCKVKFGSSPTVWRTSTKKNNFTPFWEETKTFQMKGRSQVIKIEAWDEDSGTKDPDDFLGKARISVGKILLAGGSFDVELLNEGQRTGHYISLKVAAGASAMAGTAAATTATITPVKADEEPPMAAASSGEDEEKDEPVIIPEETSARGGLSIGEVAPPVAKEPENLKVKMTAISGAGFQVEKRRFGRRADVPDVYCNISIDSSDTKWRTSTIDNNLSPVWNEDKTFTVKDDSKVVCVEVFDEDSGKTDADDWLGKAMVPLTSIISSRDGTKQLVLLDKQGSPTGAVVTVRAVVE